MAKGSSSNTSEPTAAQNAAASEANFQQKYKELMQSLSNMDAKGEAARRSAESAQMRLPSLPQLSFEDLLGHLAAISHPAPMRSLV